MDAKNYTVFNTNNFSIQNEEEKIMNNNISKVTEITDGKKKCIYKQWWR